MRLEPTGVDVRHVRDVLATGSRAAAQDLVWLSPSELAEVLLQLDAVELATLDLALGPDRLADAVAQLDPSEAAELLIRFSRAAAADILEEMEPDDATDVVDELKQSEAEDILAQMEAEEAKEIRDLLTYPSDTAGGRMTPEYVAIGPDLTVAAAMRLLRTQAPSAETIYYVYVTEPEGRLLGVVSLRDLVVADPLSRIGDIMRTQVLSVPADADQELAAGVLTENDLLALPVVDEGGHLIGVITADDVADVLEEEATEDIERLGGSQPLDVPYLRATIVQMARKRIGWLLILFVAEAYTGTVLRHFEDTMAAVVSLTFFIPLLIGTGGNVGSQITTTLTRALAVGDVRLRDLLRVLRKELCTGVIVGVIMGSVSFVRAVTLGVEPPVRIVVAVSALAIVLWASAVAAVLPLILRRFRIDPAVVSAPFIATLVDGTGLMIYFTVADRLMGLNA
ncbi:MAG TPA: magnesium transporter [Chloroflexota bacterium]|nr:magnesium transporter [Chloroflexota bacterium]